MTERQAVAGRYKIIEYIDQGAMGAVYRGEDTHTGAAVAIKELKQEIVATDPSLVDRFRREGEALRKLNHPNIVRMLDAVEEDGRHYLIMQYVGGGSLRDLINSEAQLSTERVLDIALDLADALTRAHHLKIIHRDLKPANVLIDDNGTPLLTDFGLAHLGGRTRVTETGAIIGTYAYLSPGACRGEELDGRADIWAFGVILYELLAGRRPYLEKQPAALLSAILTKPVPNLAELRPDLPEALVSLVQQMLEKDRDKRIRSARLVGATLEAITEGFELTSIDKSATPILATKLYAPPPRPKVVPRSRLIEQLDGGLHRKLTLISAPAGFGKTTLVSEWIADCERPVAWLSLDDGDNDPTRFLTYLVAALQTVAEDFGEGVLAVLQSSLPPSTESILTALLNEIATIPCDFIFVLDDYHVIDAKPVDDALAFLVEHLPPQMHLAIATREDPPLPLARMRARGQSTELRIADLRFNPDEAAAFLNQVMGLNLSAEDIASLETRTEGWIAGLQLAALSMAGARGRFWLYSGFLWR